MDKTQPAVDLRQVMERALKSATETVLGGGDVMRCFFALDDQGALRIVGAPVTGPPDQDEYLLRHVRMMFAVWNVREYAVVSEVWRSEAVGDAAVSARKQAGRLPRPSQDPNRTEAIFVMGVRREPRDDGKTHYVKWSVQAKIERGPTRVCEPEWFSEDGDVQLGGRLVNLMPPEDMVPLAVEFRDAALKALMAQEFPGPVETVHIDADGDTEDAGATRH